MHQYHQYKHYCSNNSCKNRCSPLWLQLHTITVNIQHDTVNDTPEIELCISLSTLNVMLYWCIAADWTLVCAQSAVGKTVTWLHMWHGSKFQRAIRGFLPTACQYVHASPVIKQMCVYLTYSHITIISKNKQEFGKRAATHIHVSTEQHSQPSPTMSNKAFEVNCNLTWDLPNLPLKTPVVQRQLMGGRWGIGHASSGRVEIQSMTAWQRLRV